jgi:hypothetical protein
MVNKWRIGETPNTDRSANERGKEPLKKDNVVPEEVVEIIKNHRLEIKKLSDSASPVEITKTMKEWEKIYQDLGNEMEWEAINIVAVEEAQEEQQLEGEKELHKWMEKQANMAKLRRRVVELAEEQNIIEYLGLNDDFKKRLEDVNRYQDDKETGDIRPILESPAAPARKPVQVEVEDSGSEENEEELKRRKRCRERKNKRRRVHQTRVHRERKRRRSQRSIVEERTEERKQLIIEVT